MKIRCEHVHLPTIDGRNSTTNVSRSLQMLHRTLRPKKSISTLNFKQHPNLLSRDWCVPFLLRSSSYRNLPEGSWESAVSTHIMTPWYSHHVSQSAIPTQAFPDRVCIIRLCVDPPTSHTCKWGLGSTVRACPLAGQGMWLMWQDVVRRFHVAFTIPALNLHELRSSRRRCIRLGTLGKCPW